MAATVGTLFLKGVKSGRPFSISIYNPASLAAGNYIREDWNAPAGANSPDFFSVPELCQVTDFSPGAATGQVEFTSDGKRTQVVLDYALWQTNLPQKPKEGLPQLGPGKMYRLLVISALPA